MWLLKSIHKNWRGYGTLITYLAKRMYLSNRSKTKQEGSSHKSVISFPLLRIGSCSIIRKHNRKKKENNCSLHEDKNRKSFHSRQRDKRREHEAGKISAILSPPCSKANVSLRHILSSMVWVTLRWRLAFSKDWKFLKFVD